MSAVEFFKAPPLQQREGIGHAYRGGMVMPTLPAAVFVVVQSEFFLKLLVVLFHPPAQFGQAHRAAQ
jgi:hypothetical protein